MLNVADTLLSATIAFISIWALVITSLISFYLGRSVETMGSLGTTPKNSRLGRSPFSPIVSFIAFTAMQKSLLLLTVGKSCFTLIKLLLKGSFNPSPIPSELWARSQDNHILIPALFENFFHLSDVKMGPRSDQTFFGYPMFILHQRSISGTQVSSVDWQ